MSRSESVWLRDRNGFGVSATSDGRIPRVSGLSERGTAPFYAPSTGVVRPLAGSTTHAGMTSAVVRVKGLSGVRTWSPPV